MGIYLNPGNTGFQRITESEYVDKTGMLRLINEAIGKTRNLICVSRPRRFGKSYAAQMLCAYYDRTCDSKRLFDKFEIAENPDFEKYLNRYDVIYVDMATLVGNVEPHKIVKYLSENITEELLTAYPGLEKGNTLVETLIRAVEKSGIQFIMIIDEWDAPIREVPEVENEYLMFLRALFKGSGTTARIFAAAYMTGILPIKKSGSQSAVSDFTEYTMLDPREYAQYVGFTEEEVRRECEKLGRSFESMKKWYNGYTVGGCQSIYNPYSVMQALETGKYQSYWKKSSAAETLLTYIDMDLDGLQADIVRLIAGERVVVDTSFFDNDVASFKEKDDVLTLLIHLGYLTYDEINDSYENEEAQQLTGIAWVPNEEVRTEFERILRRASHKNLITLVQKSDQLLADTIAGNEEAVAKVIQEVHDSQYAPTFYNNEQSLRAVVKMAYISCLDQYAKLEELPSGHGIADVIFLPNRRSPLPVMIIELKWNKSGEGAIRQIKEKKYPKVLENYGGEIVLVGISYDPKTKQHRCTIEFFTKTE